MKITRYIFNSKKRNLVKEPNIKEHISKELLPLFYDNSYILSRCLFIELMIKLVNQNLSKI